MFVVELEGCTSVSVKICVQRLVLHCIYRTLVYRVHGIAKTLVPSGPFSGLTGKIRDSSLNPRFLLLTNCSKPAKILFSFRSQLKHLISFIVSRHYLLHKFFKVFMRKPVFVYPWFSNKNFEELVKKIMYTYNKRNIMFVCMYLFIYIYLCIYVSTTIVM